MLPLLQRHLTAQDADAQWQLIWLNNDGQPVIGLLPKVTWCVYFNSTEAESNHNRHVSVSSPTPIQTADDQAAAWQATNYKVIKTCRDDENSVTTAYKSYSDWQDELITYSQAFEAGNSAPTLIHEESEKPSYHHGLIGFIGYDIAAYELSPTSNIPQASHPCAMLGHYDTYLSATKDTSSAASWCLNVRASNNDPDSEQENTFIIALISYLDSLNNTLPDSDYSNEPMPETESKLAPLILMAQWSKLDYQQAFEQTQTYLQQGDCYQINLTQAWRGQFDNSHTDKNNDTY